MGMTSDGAEILICEGSSGRRAALVRLLERRGTGAVAVATLAEALRHFIEPNGFRVFVADLRSFKSGTKTVWKRLRRDLPGLAVIGLIPAEDSGQGLDWIERGLFDHILGPDDTVGLYSAVRSAFEKHRLAAENAAFRKSLRRYEAEQARHEKRAAELQDIHEATIENLMTALDLRDVETFGHSQTVAKYSQALSRLLGILDESILENIRKGALLHDIGKIAIPDSILKKRSPLTAIEWEKIRLHPVVGHGLVKEIKLVREVGNIILYHHEHFDGGGYPRGWKGERIPLEARIFALADSLDAITAPRPYRKARSFDAARRDFVEHSGTQFDPKVVEAFCSLGIENWERIRLETTSFIPNIKELSKLFDRAGD
jgi:putative nucleotidyltransferase with HDIG domain